MLKLVKMASVLTVLLAVLTVGAAGYLMVFGNARMNHRADLLDKESAIESFLKALGTIIPTKNQQSPLVTQAEILEKRFAPIIVIPPTPPVGSEIDKGSEITIIGPKVDVKAKFSLLGTCIYEDFPEKSLALVDLTAKGHKWVRQGDELDHFVVHKIDESSVILHQNGHEATVINLPERPKSKLLNTTNAADPEAVGIEAIERILKSGLPKTNVKSPGQKKPRPPHPPNRPANPAQERKTTKETITAIEGMIKETETLPDKDKPADDMKIWAEVLKMLETSSKQEEKLKAAKEKKARAKKK